MFDTVPALVACTQTSQLKYVGGAGELVEDDTGKQARRFGWEPAHKHPNIEQEMKFLYGSANLTDAGGDKLEYDHLQHGDDWRLRCRKPGNGDVTFQRVTK